MNFLWTVIFTCFLLGFHCTGGYVHNRHAIVKREISPRTIKEYGLPADILISILTPIANFAEKVDVTIPIVSNFSTSNRGD